MAHGHVSHGRNVPLLIIDSKNSPALDAAFSAHQHLSLGDVATDWGEDARDSTIICLALKFQRPVVAECAIVFQLPLHAGLVDQVLIAKGLYLQLGKRGDRLSNTLDSRRLMVEVVDHPDFMAYWEYLYPRIVAKQLRDDYAISRSEARDIAVKFIKEWRDKFGNFRMPS